MKKSFILVLSVFIHISLFSQQFEGKIYFQKKSFSDTVYFTYNIKNTNIRIDEYNSLNEINKSIIFDVVNKTIVALNPHKQLYTTITAEKNNKKNDNCLITKSQNYRIINGYKCYQWRVKNIAKNTEVAYWVAKHEFEYFDELLRLWHSQDNNLDFYLELPNVSGYLPMLSVERTLLRDEKVSMAVINIEKTNIDETIFNIPPDYKSFKSDFR